MCIRDRDGIAKNMPALKRSQKLQKRAAKVGFDWPNKKMVWSKVLEELEEFEAEVERFNIQEMQSEYGDVLFSLVNYARHLNINPEDALERTNKKFKARFQAMEHLILLDKKRLTEMTLDEMDVYWEIAKKQMNGFGGIISIQDVDVTSRAEIIGALTTMSIFILLMGLGVWHVFRKRGRIYI